MAVFGTSWDDPRTMALLSAAQGLASNKSLTRGLLSGAQAYGGSLAEAKREEQKRALMQAQLDEVKAQAMQRQQAAIAAQAKAAQEAQDRARDQAFRDSIPAPEAGADPWIANMHRALQAGQVSAKDYFEGTRQKPQQPIKLGAGEVLLDPATRQPLASNPKEESQPSAVREYQYAKSQGYKGTFEQWDTSRRRAGATSVSVNAEKPLINSVAQGLGNTINDSLTNARGAVSAINTAHTLRSAIDSGKVIAGPTATWRLGALQLGQVLGITGKDGEEVLTKTRSAMQAMAQAELDAAQQMKGQGQITEAERDIIRRAAAGNIDTMTAPEIRLLSEAIEKTARGKLKVHGANVQNLSRLTQAAPLLSFYQVAEPGAYAAPASSPAKGGWSIAPVAGGR